MNETRVENIAFMFTARGSLLFSGAAVTTLVYLLMALAPLVLVPPAFPQSTTAGVRLQAGIAKEDVDGDLKSAMEIYQKIADDRSAPRDVRSRALLRLAGCLVPTFGITVTYSVRPLGPAVWRRAWPKGREDRSG